MVERSTTARDLGRMTGSSISVDISESTNSSGGSCQQPTARYSLKGHPHEECMAFAARQEDAAAL